MNSVKPDNQEVIPSQATIEELFELTTLTFDEIGLLLKLSYKQVYLRLHKLYTQEQITERKHLTYSKANSGIRNNNYRKQANYKGILNDSKGYKLILKPNWYQGRKGSKHIFYHHYVYCLHNGLPEIPKGMCVHHKDGNRINNEPSNLELLTMSEHSKLHSISRRCRD